MKKGLLVTTALVGAGVLAGGAASAAEAPEWKLSGNMNFEFYYVDQDYNAMEAENRDGIGNYLFPEEDLSAAGSVQDHGWYFGVDEAELQIDVKGAADNGLKYGFKIELQVDTNDTKVADEARIQLSGNWGTVQMGDEDGAEDIMNWGGESVMGGAGAFHYGDAAADTLKKGRIRMLNTDKDLSLGGYEYLFPKGYVLGAPNNAEIAGDTSDQTKISYFSPRFSGFQVGASITPTPNNGDDFKEDGAWENHYGLGANYVNDFGDLRIRASVVYSGASLTTDYSNNNVDGNDWQWGDVSAYSVGGVIGWGPFDIGANYTDNGDSAQPNVYNNNTNTWMDGNTTWYYDVAASFKTGPFKFAVGYFASTLEWANAADMDLTDGTGGGDAEYTQISLTADYKAAPGLSFYAEIDLTEDDSGIEQAAFTGWDPFPDTNKATVVILGTNVKF